MGAYIIGSANRRGTTSIAELRFAIGLTEVEIDAACVELTECASAWRVGDDELDTGLSYALLAYAVGEPGRPKTKTWEALKARLFAEWFEVDEPHCMYCGAKGVDLTLDHAQPVARGGSNHPRNFIAACHPCNSTKKDKTYAEFMAWRRERGL